MKIKSLFILLILLLKINYLNSVSNFTFTIINELTHGTFISPTIGEDGSLYIITGYDEELSSEKYSKFYIKYDINSLSLKLAIKYNNSHSFYTGEAFAFSENNKQYLFITSSTESPGVGSFEIRSVDTGKEVGVRWDDSSIYGYTLF